MQTIISIDPGVFGLRALQTARQNLLIGLIISILPFLCAHTTAAGELPRGFVYLRDIDPTILQDMRYGSPNNFTGTKLPGYDVGECVLVKSAALALKRVQEHLRPKGLSLMVYDCYRPVRAVAAFVRWAQSPQPSENSRAYYPRVSKSALVPWYIAWRSGHSRGASVDITLVALTPEPNLSVGAVGGPCIVPPESRASDNSIDMGTSFDCFDVNSTTASNEITAKQRENRKLLVEVMSKHGFRNYSREWWHFTFAMEQYPSTYFDFPITARDEGNAMLERERVSQRRRHSQPSHHTLRH